MTSQVMLSLDEDWDCNQVYGLRNEAGKRNLKNYWKCNFPMTPLSVVRSVSFHAHIGALVNSTNQENKNKSNRFI